MRLRMHAARKTAFSSLLPLQVLRERWRHALLEAENAHIEDATYFIAAPRLGIGRLTTPQSSLSPRKSRTTYCRKMRSCCFGTTRR